MAATGAGERALLTELSRAGHHVVERGLVVGSGGNLSVRRPGSDEVLVTGAGTWLDRLGPESFARVTLSDGRVLRDPDRPDRHRSGRRGSDRHRSERRQAEAHHADRSGVDPSGKTLAPRPSTEVALHLAVYRSRPDVTTVVHLHPQTSVLLDALGERIRLVTTDHAAYVRRVAVVPFHPPGTSELAEAVGQAVADGTNCVLLPHHGCAVVADSVEMALRRAVNLEEAARLTYRALVLTGGISARALPDCPIAYTDEALV